MDEVWFGWKARRLRAAPTAMKAGGYLAGAIVAVLLVLALGPVGIATAAAPEVTIDSPLSGSTTNNPTPSFSGSTDDPFDDVTLNIYAGTTVEEGALLQTLTTLPLSGTWSLGLSGTLTDGLYTAQATQSDEAGNTGASTPSTFTVKTKGPAVSLSPVASPTNDSTPTLGGGAGTAPGDEPTVTVTIYEGGSVGGSVAASASVPRSGGAWSYTSSHLSDGTYTAQATQSDEAGNTGASTPSTFTVDTSSPKVSINPVTSPTNDTTPTLAGGAGTAGGDAATVAVTIYRGGLVGGSVAASGSAPVSGGAWSYTPPQLSDGTYTAQATQLDVVGNTGTSAPVTFTVDTIAPTVSINPVTSPTNDTTPTLAGGAGTAGGDAATVAVTIYRGSSVDGSVAASGSAPVHAGAWSITPSSLADGTYTAQATQGDAAGNNGTSAAVTFVVETGPPRVTLNSPALRSNNTTPSFIGTASDITTVTVKIYAGASATGTVVSTATAPGTRGGWSSGNASPALKDGQYTATATQTSSLPGNPAGASSPVTFTVDTAAPRVTLNSPALRSNNTTPSFTGTASDITPVTVNIYAGATATGSVVWGVTAPVTEGGWSSGNVSPALKDGQYTATATQTSSLPGNPVGISAPVTFTVDTTPPTVSMNPVASPTTTATPTLAGKAGAAEGDNATVAVTIYQGNSVGGTVVASKNVAVSGGAWSYTPPHLNDGTYTAQATQSDEAHNTSKSAPVTFTVDTTAPAVGITTPTKGGELSVSRPTFSGSAGSAVGDQASVTLKIYTGSSASGIPAQTLAVTPSGAKWTTGSSGPQLPDGTYTAQAEQSDLAGNSGTSTSTFKIKTNSPVVTLNTAGFARRGNSLVTGATPSFNGSAAAAPETSKTVTLSIYNGAATSGSPVQTVEGTVRGATWTAGPVASLAEGTYTAQAEQKNFDFYRQPGVSESSTFTVDAISPQVTLTFPAAGSSTSSETQLVRGSAGTAEGDRPEVTLQLFSGSAIVDGQAPLQSIRVNAPGGAWSATVAGLSAGAYIMRAEQSDDVGNLGVSTTTTFEVAAPAPVATAVQPPSPPAASFSWSPTAPHPGEEVSLLSSSTDVASPITAFAWDLAGSGAFAAGGPVMSTSFSTPGRHLVQLRVTDANGLSSVAAETIEVTARPSPLMRPFPIVRITATDVPSGVKLRLLSVQASAGARITVACTGHGCPVKSQSRVAASGKAGAAPVEFRRFERSLRAGVILEIRVSKPGQIGKYTRFAIRRRRRPSRLDTCLGPTGGKPIACPSS